MTNESKIIFTELEIEKLWREFSGDWEMFSEGALYETYPNLKPWQLLDMKRNMWEASLRKIMEKKVDEILAQKNKE